MNNTLTEQRPVVFHLITGFQVGGAERMLAKVLPRLPRYSHVVISLTTDGPMRQEYVRLGLTTYVLSYTKPWKIASFVHWLRLVRRYRPAILTTYLVHADLTGRVWGKLAGVPIIISSLRARFRGQGYKKILWFLKRFDGFVTGYLPNSNEVKRYYVEELGFPSEKFTVITNGVDPNIYDVQISPEQRRANQATLGVPDQAMVVGTVSQLRPEKSVDRLIRALAQLADPSVHCLVIGDGPEWPRLASLAADLGVAPRVHFLGNRSDLSDILPLLDIFVLPSVFEGMSNALLEAMASGRAIVATDTPENREVVTPECGRLVDTANPKILADAMMSLLINTDARQRCGHASRQRCVDQFSLKRKVDQLDQFYSSLLKTV